MEWKYSDGGRKDAGFKAEADDCVTRAVCIITGREYSDVYAEVNEFAKIERPRKGRNRSSARTGIKSATVRKYLDNIGFEWVPTMQIGTGCTTHLRGGELPAGRIIANVSKHVCAVIDGVVHDTHDPTRGGTRCVYGYWVYSRP